MGSVARTARAGLVATLLCASFVVVSAEPALACSCALPDLREALADADGAFVGTLIERIDGAPPTTYWGDRVDTFRFAVETDVKANLGDPVDVVSADTGAACGLEVGVDERVGLLLTLTDDGVWISSLCSTVDPEALLRAAEPLPPPDGEGPVRLLVGGTFGDVRTISLDEQGRTLAYGEGDGDTLALDACPGGELMVESASDGRSSTIAVREVATLEIVREISFVEARFPSPYVVSCMAEDASRIAVIDTLHRNVRVHVIQGTTAEIVFEGPGRGWGSGITGDVAEVRLRGARYVQVSLADGDVLVEVDLGARLFAPRISPDGAWVAGVRYGGARPGSPPSDIVLVSTGTGRTFTESLVGWNDAGWVRWQSDDRLLFLPVGEDVDRLTVYRTPSFRALRAVDGWYANDAVRLHGVDYGLQFGRVVAADLGVDDEVRTVRVFDEGTPFALAGVPGDGAVAPG